MNNAKWTWAAIGYMTIWAYVLGIIVYQLGTLFTGGGFGFGTIVAFALIAGIIYLLVRKGYVPDESKKSLTSVEAAAR
jgi:ferrous iron transport protein B